jgi:hypothetical protein
MSPEQAKLANHILSFSIDDSPAELTFADRLAQENRWSRSFADRVILEYKRFVILAMSGSEQVTPSQQVDEAWHLHLTYTVSYWERMSPLLPRPLHHHPTKGGTKESSRFLNQYARTLELYEETFGEAPPQDIWPFPEIRFAPRAVPTSGETWQIRKSAVRGLISGFALCLVAAGCNMVDQLTNPLFSVVVFVVIGVAWLLYRVKKGGLSGSGDGCGSGCSAIGGCSSSGDGGGGGCGGGGD